MKFLWCLFLFWVALSSLLGTALSEGFENPTFPPAGWAVVNSGDANTWVRNTGSYYVHSGGGSASISYSSTAHNDWLITPQLAPTTGDVTFSFWARNVNTYIDRFNLKLSTFGTDLADFTVTLASNVGPTSSWTQYSYDLSSYVGQKVFIAIQAISTNQATLAVDDFSGPAMSGFEGFETSAFNAYPWDNTSIHPWSIQSAQTYTGTYASESGVIEDNWNTHLKITQTVSVASRIYFAEKVSTEANCDFLKFYIDDVEQGSWSGESGWNNQSYAVSAGTHTFRWSYSKNGSGAAGSDKVWIDHIVFPPTILGTEATPILITTPTELNNVRNNLGSATQMKYFKLMNDIDLSSYGNAWVPIGTNTNYFYGNFDGNNHTISNLRCVSYGYYHGLFGITGAGSVIRNLVLASTCYVLGDTETGSITGRNNGTVQNCSSAASVYIGRAEAGGGLVGFNTGTIIGSSFSGSVSRSGSDVGSNKLGGIAGNNASGSIITNCSSSGMITGSTWNGGLVGWNDGAINRSFSTGSINCNNNTIGGLVGQNQGSINDCYSRVNVSGVNYLGGLVGYHGSGSITNSYSTGTVTGGQKGGLIGASGGTVSSSYWDTQTSGIATSYGGTGKTTAQMKTQSTYTGWDFAAETANGSNDYWYITSSDNNGYPFLNWEHASELRAPVLTYPAYFASGLPLSGFNLTWTANPTGQAPHHYTLTLAFAESMVYLPENADYVFTNLTATSFNPVTQGGIVPSYGQIMYWTVRGYTAEGVAFPVPSAYNFIFQQDPYGIDSFELGNTDGSTAISEWTQALGAGSNYWTVNSSQTSYNRTPRTGSYNVTLNSQNGGDAWMFRAIPLTSGILYNVEMYARQDTAVPANANIGIYLGVTSTIAGMNRTIATQTGLISGGYQRVYGSFIAGGTGTYYIGIHGMLNASANYISLDDFTCHQTPPVLTYSPHALDFNAALSGTYTNKNILISNSGGETLTLAAGDVTILGADAAQFGILGAEMTFPINLTAGHFAPVTVYFHPTSLGIKSATLRITYNSGNYDVALSGTCLSASALLESFEGTFPPTGWTQDGNWSAQNNSVYHGSKSAYRWTWNNSDVTLSTPVLTLTGSSIVNFKTFTATSTFQKIQLAYYDPATSAWVNIGSEISLIPDSWQNHSILLSGITGHYKLGFAAYYAAGETSAGVYLDYVYGPDITPPGAPVPTFPQADAINVSEIPTFTWDTPASGGFLTGYKVFCDTNANPVALVTPTLVTANTFALPNALSYSTDYYWKVVAYGAGADSTSSSIRKFTTNADPMIVSFPHLQDFSGTSFPPYGWARDIDFSWIRNEYFGISGWGDGCVEVDFYYQGSQVVDLDTPLIDFHGQQGMLTFAHAYAPRSDAPANIDQLEIQYSTDGGSNYLSLALFSGGENGLLNTAAATASYFLPDTWNWAYKTVKLPLGTNKVRFRGISGHGNSLWLDNITFDVAHFAGGTGTEASPFQITNASQLDLVNTYLGSSHADKHFLLMNDIDLTSYLAPGGTGYTSWGESGWAPIGDLSSAFSGHFDGNSKKVLGLHSNRPSTTSCGLFGATMAGSLIENLGIETTGQMQGTYNVAMLVGFNEGTIANCYAIGNVNGVEAVGGLAAYNYLGTITDCYANCNLDGENTLGALVGMNNYGTISRCYSAGSLIGTYAIGGLVGYNFQGSIANSYSTASVTCEDTGAGLVALNRGTISNCYATGAITRLDEGGTYGGLSSYSDNATVIDSYWDKETTGMLTSVGSLDSFGKTTAQMKMQSTFVGWDFGSTWFIDPSVNSGYPQLRWTTGEISTPAVPSNVLIQSGAAPGTITISWDNMGADWYGVYTGTSASNLVYLGWTSSNSIILPAENLGFFAISSGSGAPTSPALVSRSTLREPPETYRN